MQQLVKFIMFMEKLAYLVLNTIFLFSLLTQLEIYIQEKQYTKNQEELFISSHIK